ncbi:MAG: Ig-like domain-containing protein [Deltaproteobacteria bacterium]|nr:Ig-like domain-containing protein [Deltaproteobacteria bacterium]
MVVRIACRVVIAAALLCGCDSSTPPLATAEPGVVFTFPVDGQRDVPLGSRIVVTFSDEVASSALGSFTLMGPAGPVDAMPEVVGNGKSVQFAAAPLEEGATYQLIVGQALAPTAKNLPSGPLVTFTTRTARPRAAAPTLVAVNGGEPQSPAAFRPMYESSTIRLVFSEPIDPRTVTAVTGAVELIDTSTRMAVPATILASGIHVSIDPKLDLRAGTAYELRVGNRLVDLGGQPLTPAVVMLTPSNSRGTQTIPQVLRTRQANDPGPEHSRAGAERNVIAIDKPLIGKESSTLLPVALDAELGDPKALGGPIAFTLRKGQRLRATGLDVKLGGEISVGLETGEILIELLTDAGGRLYRNPHQAADQRPENARAPLYVDLSMDVAVYAVDPKGNAVLTQTVLGVQASGTAVSSEGVLAIEAVASMELGLLGVTAAPTNFVLELITDPAAKPAPDITPPALVATMPSLGANEHPVDEGVEVIFNEPVDLDKLRAGGLRLETNAGTAVATVIESHGAAVVVRPIAPLAYSTSYRVVLSDVVDAAGNKLPATNPIAFTTPRLVNTDAPITVTAIHPGVPCALTGANGSSPGRCQGGQSNDDLYDSFTLPANEMVQIAFSQPPQPSSIVRGIACNQGSVRIEEIDGAGTCIAAIAGTLMTHNRTLTFVPDKPWVPAKRYRVRLVSGTNSGCTAGELCNFTGVAASFDPLGGTTNGEAGGPDLSIAFLGAEPVKSTFLLADTAPFTDVNGSGFVESGEPLADENRAALEITGTTGDISQARFTSPDCLPGRTGTQACMYLTGSMPVEMGEVTTSCPLPDGSSAASCVPVKMSAQAMYATSVSMNAQLVIGIDTDTGTSVMRIREPAGGGGVTGYIVNQGGSPMLLVKLDLYMDAPDMSLPLGTSHDLHSKPLSMTLKGPVSFLPDGRIAISVANTADLPVVVKADAALGLGGNINMKVPAGEMKLQLLSPPLRGVAR